MATIMINGAPNRTAEPCDDHEANKPSEKSMITRQRPKQEPRSKSTIQERLQPNDVRGLLVAETQGGRGPQCAKSARKKQTTYKTQQDKLDYGDDLSHTPSLRLIVVVL